MDNLTDLTNPGAGQFMCTRTAPAYLPLIQRRADAPVLEDAYGRLSVNITTRPGSNQRLIQSGRRAYNSDAAARINAALGGQYSQRRSTPANLSEVSTASRAAAVLDQKLSK
jgi:hypothetical protein